MTALRIYERTAARGLSKAFVGMLAVAMTVNLAPLALTSIGQAQADGIDSLPRVTQELVAPPLVPQHDQVANAGRHHREGI